VCQNNPCKLCRGGACVDNNGESCGNSLCKECRDGQCVYKAKGTSCNGEGQCINGACVEPPPCDGKGTECSWGLNCCSLDCVNGQCAVSGVGDYCRTSRDCNVNDVAGLNYCDTNFQCREPGIGS
jgi:hypothetical protein